VHNRRLHGLHSEVGFDKSREPNEAESHNGRKRGNPQDTTCNGSLS